MNTVALNALAHEIAYHAARSDIECNTAYVIADRERWWNLRRTDIIWRADVRLALRYLKARGLLVRHATKRHLVRILDAKEAQS